MDRSYERGIMENNAKGYQEIANGYQRLYMKWKKEIYSKLSDAFKTYK